MPDPGEGMRTAMARVRAGTPMRHVSGYLDPEAPARLYLSLDLDHYVTLPDGYLADVDADTGTADVWVPATETLTVTAAAPGQAGATLLDAPQEWPLPPGGAPLSAMTAMARCTTPRTSHTLGWCAES